MHERSEVKADGVPVCDTVPLCVSTVKKAKLDGPQGKTRDAGNRKREAVMSHKSLSRLRTHYMLQPLMQRMQSVPM